MTCIDASGKANARVFEEGILNQGRVGVAVMLFFHSNIQCHIGIDFFLLRLKPS